MENDVISLLLQYAIKLDEVAFIPRAQTPYQPLYPEGVLPENVIDS